MKTPRATLVASVIPLLLTSLALTAGELPLNPPAADRAQESAQLLHQAARAIDGSPALHARGQRISNLWLFPTAEADTVFARYNLSSNEEGASSSQPLCSLP